MTTTPHKRETLIARGAVGLLESARSNAPKYYLKARRLMPTRIADWSSLAAILLVNALVQVPPIDKILAVAMAASLLVLGYRWRNHQVLRTREAAVHLLGGSRALDRLDAWPLAETGGHPGEATQPRPVEVSQ